MQLVKDHPIHALRSCFHHRDGGTDTAKAAEFFGVSQRTVQYWIKNNAMPHWSIKLLEIRHRGYLPNTGPWKDFYIHGDTMYFDGYRAINSLTPNQIRSFELLRPPYEPNDVSYNDKFWEKFAMHDKIKPVH